MEFPDRSTRRQEEAEPKRAPQEEVSSPCTSSCGSRISSGQISQESRQKRSNKECTQLVGKVANLQRRNVDLRRAHAEFPQQFQNLRNEMTTLPDNQHGHRPMPRCIPPLQSHGPYSPREEAPHARDSWRTQAKCFQGLREPCFNHDHQTST